MKAIWIITLFALSACTSMGKPKAPPLARTLIFPNGIYHHDVELKVPKTAEHEEKNFGFNGVVKISDDTIQVVALSPFGTTAFRITEDRVSHGISDEIYLAQMRKFEPKLLEYYSTLRELLTLQWHDEKVSNIIWKEVSADQLPLLIEFLNEKADPPEKAVFKFIQYDEQKMPIKMEIIGEKFEVKIKVSRYEI
jgi:hypothetical protein